VKERWEISVKGEFAKLHLAEHKEYLEAVLSQVNGTGEALELYWRQKEEQHGIVESEKVVSCTFEY
jgi:hypothetical protein